MVCRVSVSCRICVSYPYPFFLATNYLNQALGYAISISIGISHNIFLAASKKSIPHDMVSRQVQVYHVVCLAFHLSNLMMGKPQLSSTLHLNLTSSSNSSLTTSYSIALSTSKELSIQSLMHDLPLRLA